MGHKVDFIAPCGTKKYILLGRQTSHSQNKLSFPSYTIYDLSNDSHICRCGCKEKYIIKTRCLYICFKKIIFLHQNVYVFEKLIQISKVFQFYTEHDSLRDEEFIQRENVIEGKEKSL